MLNRFGRSPLGVLLALAFSFSAAAVSGCRTADVTDEAYGAIDLAPYFYDGSTPSAPTAALPRDLRPLRGWMNGLRAEYYDFGLVSSTSKRTSSGGTTGVPDISLVHPMYFFFDSSRRPLFSRPVLDPRTQQWSMRGGLNLLLPYPKSGAKRDIPYSVRVRTLNVDKVRLVADYQRPIINRLLNDSDYTGLWEIVEVVANNGSYEPDSIKSFATLQNAIDQGIVTTRRTAKVINCPAVDDRTYVWPSAMGVGVPRPRMEYWYRTKLGSCYLANGWEALGDTNLNIYKAAVKGREAAEDARRLDTFDIIRYSVGSGAAQYLQVVAAVGKIYAPMVRVASQTPTSQNFDIRYGGDDLSDSLPRHTEADAPGYRPIRWLNDIKVAQDPAYEPGTFKNVADIDPALIAARGSLVRNYPVIGTAINCNCPNGMCDDSVCPTGQNCNEFPDNDIATTDPSPAVPGASAAERITYLIKNREGGPRCDVRAASFGDFCAPGVARCATKLSGQEDTNIKAIVPTPSVGGVGYACHPAQSGFCYIRCDSAVAAPSKPVIQDAVKLVVKNRDPSLPADKTQTVAFALDPRCGGDKMPGYACLSPSTTPATPTKLRVCVRTCNPQDADNKSQAICEYPWSQTINDAIGSRNIQAGTMCLGVNSITACIWNPAYYPRDPKVWQGD